MRPAGWPPMDMSKKTCGIATVFFGGRIATVFSGGGGFCSFVGENCWERRRRLARAVKALRGLRLARARRGTVGEASWPIFCHIFEAARSRACKITRRAVCSYWTLHFAIGLAMIYCVWSTGWDEARRSSKVVPLRALPEPIKGPIEHCWKTPLDAWRAA